MRHTGDHPHGTWRRYRLRGCRCDECRRAWNTRGAMEKRRRGEVGWGDGLLAASCWCEASFVGVTPADVKAGRTGSCGRQECRA